jgi:hypothetical protein
MPSDPADPAPILQNGSSGHPGGAFYGLDALRVDQEAGRMGRSEEWVPGPSSAPGLPQ